MTVLRCHMMMGKGVVMLLQGFFICFLCFDKTFIVLTENFKVLLQDFNIRTRFSALRK